MKKVFALVLISLLLIASFAEARDVSRVSFVKNINILFLKEDYSGLVSSVKHDLKRARLSRREKKEVLYLTGLSYIKLGQYSKARESFNKILSMKGDKFRQDAYIGVADSYFYEKNFRKAIRAYESILNMYSKIYRLSSLYFNLGRSYEAIGNSTKANFYYKKVKRDFSSSFEAGKTKPTYASTKKEPSFYIIQLGAFKSLRNAKRLQRRLRSRKFDSYIQKVRRDGVTLYRIRGGKFSNKSYADRLLRKLRRAGFSAKIVEE